MPNGKPGDHPITDICVHRVAYFRDDVDELIRQIVARGGEGRIYKYVVKHDPFFGKPADLDEMQRYLTTVLAELDGQDQ